MLQNVKCTIADLYLHDNFILSTNFIYYCMTSVDVRKGDDSCGDVETTLKFWFWDSNHQSYKLSAQVWYC